MKITNTAKKWQSNYLQEAVECVSYQDPNEKGLLALKLLRDRLTSTRTAWRAVPFEGHTTLYMPYLICANKYLQQREWSLACNQLGNVLSYNRNSVDSKGNLIFDAEMLENVYQVIRKGLNDVD